MKITIDLDDATIARIVAQAEAEKEMAPECRCARCEASRGIAAAEPSQGPPQCLNCALDRHGECLHGRRFAGYFRICRCGCARQLELEGKR